jgi:NAD dependent epimerase/dehydratase family enzyme
VNATAPSAVRNSELTRGVPPCLHRPGLLPVPAFVLRAALGELAVELLGSRRVVPRRALERGFSFRHTSIDTALAAELREA